jgi:hypothetical protein
MLEAALVRLRPDGRPPGRKRYGWYRLYSSSGLHFLPGGDRTGWLGIQDSNRRTRPPATGLR